VGNGAQHLKCAALVRLEDLLLRVVQQLRRVF
jgi:hypothetical protein